jgi:hypothetical protein
MQDDQLQRDLEQMSGSPAIAKQLKESLGLLARGGAGPELAEMAQELLEGRTDLRTVAASSAYSDHLTKAVDRYDEWQAQLTPEERDRAAAETRERLAQQGDR